MSFINAKCCLHFFFLPFLTLPTEEVRSGLKCFSVGLVAIVTKILLVLIKKTPKPLHVI